MKEKLDEEFYISKSLNMPTAGQYKLKQRVICFIPFAAIEIIHMKAYELITKHAW